MTIEKLKERLKLLEQSREQAVFQVNALAGAIQETQYWISEEEKQAEKPVDDNPTTV